jgi:hypothetical protein
MRNRDVGYRGVRILSGLCAACVCAGCGDSTPAPAPPAVQPVTASPAETWPPQTTANDGNRPPLLVVPAESGPVATPPAVPVGPSPQSRAKAALRTLTNKGVEAADWEAAHQELVDLGLDAAEVLRAALAGSDPLAREWSASILALNVEAAIAARDELKACLNDDSGYVRANAAAALTMVPDEADHVLPVLVELARSTDPDLRRMAAVNLGNFGAEAAPQLELLTPLLDSADPEVQRPVVELLGRLGTAARPTLPRLQQIAFEPMEGELRSAARQAVQQIETADAAAKEPAAP